MSEIRDDAMWRPETQANRDAQHKRVAVAVFIRDHAGRYLLMRPPSQMHWFGGKRGVPCMSKCDQATYCASTGYQHCRREYLDTALCDGCDVRAPHEHRCHGEDVCSCESCNPSAEELARFVDEIAGGEHP